MDLASVIVPIIVAVVTATAGVYVASINSFLFKPAIDIDLDGEPNNSSTLITITNKGTAPATSMMLSISAPLDFSLVKKISSVNVQSINDVGSEVQVTVPKFVDGPGSILILQSSTNRDIPEDDYTVYATYDQGSTSSTSNQDKQENGFLSSLDISSPTYWIILGSGLVAYVISAVFVLIIGRRRTTSIRLRNHMIETRSLLSDNKEYAQSIEDIWSKISKSRRRIFLMKDYLAIDNLYRKIRERNLFLRNNPDNSSQLRKLNEKCLRLIDEVLLSIDWSAYIRLRFRSSRPEKEAKSSIIE